MTFLCQTKNKTKQKYNKQMRRLFFDFVTGTNTLIKHVQNEKQNKIKHTTKKTKQKQMHLILSTYVTKI